MTSMPTRKHVRNPLTLAELFLAASCTFFVPSKNAIRNWVFLLSNITYGVVNSKNYVQNPLNHRKLFLATSCTFFVPTKNAIRIWVFFAFKHHIWGGQQQKNGAKSSKPKGTFFRRLAVLFLPASWTFFVPSKNAIKNLSFFCFQTSHMGWSTAEKWCKIL